VIGAPARRLVVIFHFNVEFVSGAHKFFYGFDADDKIFLHPLNPDGRAKKRAVMSSASSLGKNRP
jgi:hypothetical protein